MLFRNDIFTCDGTRFRFLHADPSRDAAWVIALDDPHAWPLALPITIVQRLSADAANTAQATPVPLAPSSAMLLKRDEAYARLRPLTVQLNEIYARETRGSLVQQRAYEVSCSERTLYKDLRRWFQGGQVPDALMARYDKSGRNHTSGTEKRGRKSVIGANRSGDDEAPESSARTYQLTERDLEIFHKHLNKSGGYLKDARISQASAYQRLLEEHYSTVDGNGDKYIRSVGERPSLRQFTHFLRTQYSLESKLRARKGDKDFELAHAAKVGSIIEDCRGVGHYYEIDATIVDCQLVSASDVRNIIGKPTLYHIIDRKSRLIVGYYCGLENASWTGAMQAIFSIASDKRKMCERYEVTYNPEDWPADKVFPREFLADRGTDQLSGHSNQVCEGLAITYTNLPSKMAKWKPIVEGSFRTMHQSIADVAPSYDPVVNAKRRQGKHYDKDACLTLDEFNALMLRAIISHNRKAMPGYNRSIEEVNAGVQPSPLHLWNYDIQKSSANLTRYTEEQVRHALLPREQATITDSGIKFRGCFYTCPEAEARGWFIQARHTGRVDIQISFDYRLVDSILVHSPTGRGETFPAYLTSRTQKYSGMSFAEVAYYQNRENDQAADITQNRLQTIADYHSDVENLIKVAKKRLSDSGAMSRSSRRKDVKPARNDARQAERMELVQLGGELVKSGGRIAGAAKHSEYAASQTEKSTITTKLDEAKMTPKERFQEQRRKMLNVQ